MSLKNSGTMLTEQEGIHIVRNTEGPCLLPSSISNACCSDSYIYRTCVSRSDQEVLLDPHFVFHVCRVAVQRHPTDQEIPGVLSEHLNGHHFKL